MALGYARETPGAHPLGPQIDALTEAGVDPGRIYTDAVSYTHLTLPTNREV